MELPIKLLIVDNYHYRFARNDMIFFSFLIHCRYFEIFCKIREYDKTVRKKNRYKFKSDVHLTKKKKKLYLPKKAERFITDVYR